MMSNQAPTLFSFKVDIDTFEGAREGIPRLISFFKKHGLPATFLGVMGPDNSGRAAFRVFTHKGFLKKMLRTNAAANYGLKTMFYGTLLPAPMMSVRLKDLYRRIIDEGFEFGMHGYDHISWHNSLTEWSGEKIEKEYLKMVSCYRDAVGMDPSGEGTPGWQESLNHLKASDRLNLLYRSDTRFSQPYFPTAGEYVSKTLEIPTTFPSLDEALGILEDKSDASLVSYMMKFLARGKVNVFTLHTEMEGRAYLPFMEKFTGELKRVEGIGFHTLQAAAGKILQGSNIPKKGFRMGEVPGRAGLVAVAEEDTL